MEPLETITAVLGWCTLINFGVLMLSSLALVFFRERLIRIHGRMFGLPVEQLGREYFRYLATYKVLVIIFNLVPYLALRIVA